MKAKEKLVRDYVRNYYRGRNGRNVRVETEVRVVNGQDVINQPVTILLDGNGSQMHKGKDVSGGRIFAGYLDDLYEIATR